VPKPTSLIAACGLALAGAVVLPACDHAGPAPALEVTLVKRTEKLTYPGGMQSAAPTDPKGQVLLVFKVTGVTWEEFSAIPRDKVFVKAGDTTHGAHVLGHADRRNLLGRVTGSVSLFASVPRSAVRFSLHVGDRPPVAFEAEPSILPDLQPRK